MKLVFDINDLNEKLTELLALQGLKVRDTPKWSTGDDGPVVSMEIDVVSPEPSHTTVIDPAIEQFGNKIVESILQHIKQTPVVPDKSPEIEDPEEGLNINEILENSKRVERLKKKAEKDQNLLGDPRKTAYKKGTRTLAENEFSEFPK